MQKCIQAIILNLFHFFFKQPWKNRRVEIQPLVVIIVWICHKKSGQATNIFEIISLENFLLRNTKIQYKMGSTFARMSGWTQEKQKLSRWIVKRLQGQMVILCVLHLHACNALQIRWKRVEYILSNPFYRLVNLLLNSSGIHDQKSKYKGLLQQVLQNHCIHLALHICPSFIVFIVWMYTKKECKMISLNSVQDKLQGMVWTYGRLKLCILFWDGKNKIHLRGHP